MKLPWNKITINDSFNKVLNVSNQLFNEKNHNENMDACNHLYEQATGYDDYMRFRKTVLELRRDNSIINKIPDNDRFNYYAVMLIMRTYCKHEYYSIIDYLASLKDTNMYVSRAIIKAFTRINESCWLAKIDSIIDEYMKNNINDDMIADSIHDYNSDSDDTDMNSSHAFSCGSFYLTLRKFIDIAVSVKLRSKMNMRLTINDIQWLSSSEYVDFMTGVTETNRITAGAVNMHNHDVIHMLTCKPCDYMQYTGVGDDPLSFLFTSEDSMGLLTAKIRFINAMMSEAGVKRDSCRIVSQLRITPSLKNYLTQHNMLRTPGNNTETKTESITDFTANNQIRNHVNNNPNDSINIDDICIKAWNQLTAWIESDDVNNDEIMEPLIHKYDDALRNESIILKQQEHDDIIMNYDEYMRMVNEHHDNLLDDVFRQYDVCNQPVNANHDFLSTNSIRYVSMRSWSWSFYNPDSNVINTINYCIRNNMEIDMVGLAMVCLLTEALNSIIADNNDYRQLLYDRIMRMRVLVDGIKILIQGYPLEFAVQSALADIY